MGYGLDKQTEDALLDAMNDYVYREHCCMVCDSLDEYVDDDGKIALAYTEYGEGDDYEYDSVQVSYDLLKHEYVYTVMMNDGSENILHEPVALSGFMADLCACSFDDFLSSDLLW